MADEIRDSAALCIARFRLQHWLTRLAAAKVNDDEEELHQAPKFVAAYQVFVHAGESVKQHHLMPTEPLRSHPSANDTHLCRACSFLLHTSTVKRPHVAATSASQSRHARQHRSDLPVSHLRHPLATRPAGSPEAELLANCYTVERPLNPRHGSAQVALLSRTNVEAVA
jgi:hypothetical protein